MNATRLLREEHAYILRAIVIIDEMAARVAAGEMPDVRDVETIREFLRFFGDDHHQEKEESTLFPAMLHASKAACQDADHASLCQITFEHNQQRSLLEGLEDSLKTHDARDFLYYAKRLGELVRAHIQTEEDELFKRAEAILTPEEDERVAQELAAYGSPVHIAKVALLRERLVALELKYLVPLSAETRTKQHV